MDFARHKHLEDTCGVKVYFAHEQCPRERGPNEQMNGSLRKFIPGGITMDQLSPPYVKRAGRRPIINRSAGGNLCVC